jgi:hypothetical protein
LDTDTDRPLLDSVCNKGLQSRSTPKKMSKSSTKSQEDQNKHSNEDKSSRSPQTEPKPPLTAYSWFMKHKRLELLRENPEISASEIMQKIAQMWKNIDPSQQQVRNLFVRNNLLLSSFAKYSILRFLKNE